MILSWLLGEGQLLWLLSYSGVGYAQEKWRVQYRNILFLPTDNSIHGSWRLFSWCFLKAEVELEWAFVLSWAVSLRNCSSYMVPVMRGVRIMQVVGFSIPTWMGTWRKKLLFRCADFIWEREIWLAVQGKQKGASSIPSLSVEWRSGGFGKGQLQWEACLPPALAAAKNSILALVLRPSAGSWFPTALTCDLAAAGWHRILATQGNTCFMGDEAQPFLCCFWQQTSCFPSRLPFLRCHGSSWSMCTLLQKVYSQQRVVPEAQRKASSFLLQWELHTSYLTSQNVFWGEL